MNIEIFRKNGICVHIKKQILTFCHKKINFKRLLVMTQNTPFDTCAVSITSLVLTAVINSIQRIR